MSRQSSKRQPRAQVLDLTIRGDELEHDRIQLEHNLQRTDLSLQLSSQDDLNNYNDSIEYPRHTSNQSSFPEFRSFVNRSADNFDSDMNHAWSYRTMDDDDDEGVSPYGGETMSTAAHHASGLTLSAGLHGRNRRDVSLSGAEFDPERPLRDLMGGMDSKMSIFDADPSRSRYPPPHNLTSFDPLVVEDTAELDQLLESGYIPPASHNSRSVRVQSHHSSSSSSDSEGGTSSRPKISDSLRRVSFSPKRPRSPRAQPSKLPSNQSRHAPSPLRRRSAPSVDEQDIPTPKARHAKSSNTTRQPEVRLHPPTPSTGGSKFSKMARGITKELDEELEKTRRRGRRSDYSIDESREYALPAQPTPRRSSLKQPQFPVGHNSKSRIYLPDVTGLTSAVASPMKTGLQHHPFNASREARESDARLLSAISAVQSKLRQLEDENGISRRRVRELEHELELCKIEVARERAILVQREEFAAQQQWEREAEETRRRKGKGKAKARDVSVYNEDVSRYQEVVEEKKALEALVKTLRSHLARLTEELSSHQALLAELRNLRDTDSKTLKEKSADIDRLRSEVERLAGEVEVLRGVVEEGLKERRLSREQSEATKSRVVAPEPEPEPEPSSVAASQPAYSASEEESEEEDDGEFDAVSIPGSSRANMAPADKTMRTDHATLGSMSAGVSTSVNPGRFIDEEELDQISADIDERRSGHAESVASQSRVEFSRSQSPTMEPISALERSLDNHEELEERVPTPGPSRQPPCPRPAAPTPGHAKRNSNRRRLSDDEVNTPFPQIRGARLERLFFNAPDHNSKTCNVCFRRRANCGEGRAVSPTWLPSRLERHRDDDEAGAEDDEDEDEGFAEGSDDVEDRRNGQANRHIPFAGQGTQNGTPPQTVLTKVIRELEDDFTHYKSVYVEIADQYKILDAVSDVPKRNLVARHLREVVDLLEQKGDQIADLYDLLKFKDRDLGRRVRA